jgi:hypothetical protein
MKKIREQADFDQAENQPAKLRTFDKQEFSDRGRADTKVRPNDPRFADNPMADKPTNDERLLDEFFDTGGFSAHDQDSLIDRLHQMFNNADISDQQIRGGIELAQSGKAKVAARLGIGPDEVDMYINSLVQQLRDDDANSLENLTEQYYNAVNVMDEDDQVPDDEGTTKDDRAMLDDLHDQEVKQEAGQPKRPFDEDRYSYEPDALGSVTVRDTTTGKSTFLQGTQATRLLAQLKSQKGNEDALLAPLVEALDDTPADGSFWGEIKADTGTYNFQWEINGQHGTGTVMFQVKGKPKMQLIGVRDMHGNEVETDPAMQQQLQQQAMAFIGKE